jgi:hypothetical protein
VHTPYRFAYPGKQMAAAHYLCGDYVYSRFLVDPVRIPVSRI